MSTAARCCSQSSTPPRRAAASTAASRTSGCPGGLLLASGAFSLASLLPDDAFLAWGWRACFVLSLLLLAIGAYIRLTVMETPAFEKVQQRKEVSTMPLKDLLAAEPKRLLLGMGTRYIEGFTFNFFSVYLLAYTVNTVGLSKSLVLGGVMAGAAVGVVLVPITGALSDRIGRQPVYRAGAWLALVAAFPVAALVESGDAGAVFLVFVTGLGVIYGTVYGPLAAFWSELFDTRYRYTALSTLYQVSGWWPRGSPRSSRRGWSRRETVTCGGWPSTTSWWPRCRWCRPTCSRRRAVATSTRRCSRPRSRCRQPPDLAPQLHAPQRVLARKFTRLGGSWRASSRASAEG